MNVVWLVYKVFLFDILWHRYDYNLWRLVMPEWWVLCAKGRYLQVPLPTWLQRNLVWTGWVQSDPCAYDLKLRIKQQTSWVSLAIILTFFLLTLSCCNCTLDLGFWLNTTSMYSYLHKYNYHMYMYSFCNLYKKLEGTQVPYRHQSTLWSPILPTLCFTHPHFT